MDKGNVHLSRVEIRRFENFSVLVFNGTVQAHQAPDILVANLGVHTSEAAKAESYTVDLFCWVSLVRLAAVFS